MAAWFFGDLVAGKPPRRAGPILLVEAGILILAWWIPPLAGPLLASAMGMHNALVLRATRVNLALTYVTGTLVHFMRSIAARLARRSDRVPSWPYMAMSSSLIAGGVVGANGFRVVGSDMFLALAALMIIIGGVVTIRQWQMR